MNYSLCVVFGDQLLIDDVSYTKTSPFPVEYQYHNFHDSPAVKKCSYFHRIATIGSFVRCEFLNRMSCLGGNLS